MIFPYTVNVVSIEFSLPGLENELVPFFPFLFFFYDHTPVLLKHIPVSHQINISDPMIQAVHGEIVGLKPHIRRMDGPALVFEYKNPHDAKFRHPLGLCFMRTDLSSPVSRYVKSCEALEVRAL